MKIITIFLLLLLLPIISAVEFDMEAEFDQGETLMARISGNFVEQITKDDVYFYRGHVRISQDFDVGKIDNEFYIYAQLLDKMPHNYSIAVEGVRYMVGSQISEDTLTKNFTITNATADFKISPGFVITKQDFSVEVQNLQDYGITININTESSGGGTGFFASLFGESSTGEDSVILKSGEIEKINFELGDMENPTLQTITLSTENLKYEIPVYIYLNKTDNGEDKVFDFNPSELDVSMPTSAETTRIIYLENLGENKLENITLSLSNSLEPYVSLSVEEIDDLEENLSAKLELNFTSDSEVQTIQGQITANANDEIYAYCGVILNFIEDYVEDQETHSVQTCEEMAGIICEEDEECDGESKYAKDGKCCMGTCKIPKESSSGKIIGWTIVIAVIAFVIWFFKAKYRGAKRTIDLFKIGKKRK